MTMKQLILATCLFALVTFFSGSVSAQTATSTPLPTGSYPCITNSPLSPQPSCAIQVNQTQLGFAIPNLSDVLTFAIRIFFIIGGLVALLFLLLGALAWITSGGDKENISKAQSKITSAIIGVLLIVVVLAIMVTLEQVVFAGRICLGLSCPITIPSLLQPIENRQIVPAAGTETLTASPSATITLPPGTQINQYNQNNQNRIQNQISPTRDPLRPNIMPDTGGGG